jgi:ribonucleoside-triphosphate reductase
VPDKALKILKWTVNEMERRYGLLKDKRVKKLDEYNAKVTTQEALPRIVVIIDELADLMMNRNTKKDTELYPLIKTANQGDGTPFYTNSSQLPVSYTDDIFENLGKQDKLQTLYTGGTVIHLFLGEQIHDKKMVPALVKKICENYHLPYFSLTPTFSVCDKCGYLSGEHKSCEKCGEECEVYSRIVGYLRPVHLWNDAKRNEFSKRSTFNLSTKKVLNQ